MRILEVAAQLLGAHGLRLEQQNVGDDLQAVVDAMLRLGEEQLLLSKQLLLGALGSTAFGYVFNDQQELRAIRFREMDLPGRRATSRDGPSREHRARHLLSCRSGGGPAPSAVRAWGCFCCGRCSQDSTPFASVQLNPSGTAPKTTTFSNAGVRVIVQFNNCS
jgi:hypothetical protein